MFAYRSRLNNLIFFPLVKCERVGLDPDLAPDCVPDT
jgi:hypothetical protein